MQGPDRTGAGDPRRPGRRAPLDRQRLDGLQQQGPAGPQLRAVFHRAPGFEFARAAGVSPVLFYDPPGRVVATVHPDDSYVKTVFDPWHRAAWDANDTVLLDPGRTRTCGGYVQSLPCRAQPGTGRMATWYATAHRRATRPGRAARRRADASNMPTPRHWAGSTRSAGPSWLWHTTGSPGWSS